MEGPAPNETTGTATKRARRKKTFAELKEEESLLLEEGIYLKKELASLRATFKEQRARNENLKRMKLDLDLHSSKNLRLTSIGLENAISSQPEQRVVSSLNNIPSTFLTQATGDDHPQSDPCETLKAVSTEDGFFLLPDLNMMPSEEDSGSETLYGIS